MAAVNMQDFSAKYIYEPWKAPIADQKAANCRIGVDYPKPICDHAQVSKENVEKLKQAYANQPQHAKSPIKAKTAVSTTDDIAGQSGTGHSQANTGHSHAETSQPPVAAQQSAKEAGHNISSTEQTKAATPSAVNSSSHNTTDRHQTAAAAAQTTRRHNKQSGSSSASQEAHPASGFDDVAMPKDPQEAGNHETDAAEPEASMPGGCASGKSSKPLAPEDNPATPGPKGSEVPEALAKQKKLDWTAVAASGEKRKRSSDVEMSPQGKRRSPRQKKLNFAGKA